MTGKMKPSPDLLMSLETARKIGMAFFHAGKSHNDLLGYFDNDKRSPNFRQALGTFEQLRKRYDDDDRSSEEHSEEADRLEALAKKEKDPKVKNKLKDKAEFHREEVGLDSVAARMRQDSNERIYAFEKLTSSLAELKSRADKVFKRAGKFTEDDTENAGAFSADDDDDCADDAGTGRKVR